jgi:hypothetical protein
MKVPIPNNDSQLAKKKNKKGKNIAIPSLSV